MSGANRHYVLAAGGTGGHLIPAFALATELDRRGHHVALITDERGAAIPGKPDFLPAHTLPAGRFGKNPLNWIKGAKAVFEGRKMALRLFESFEPSAVIGFGGYPSMPALLASTSAGIPSLVHEQNAVLGRVNRLLAGRVQAIATAYPEIKRLKPKHADKVHLVGNPVRAEVLQLREEPFPAFTEEGLLRVLITGGSQGASVLSEIVPDGLAMLPPALRSRLQVIQQCRAEDIDAVRERYRNHDIPAELGTYFENMAERLADAHLFIGRAGASTIAELTAVGRPAILIPLPIATDDHQTANARELSKSGGARSIPQPAFTAKELAKQIQALAQRPDTLGTAAHAAWNCGRPKAVKDLADLIESAGGDELMDVIRVDNTQSRGARQQSSAPQGAAKDNAQ
ncbi:undecaprenyldiphospho-muramoylpentapeptide beta-N-acetylglucosaminyltransferase [Pontixanthobacter gangjinensis]|uniref:UDP-N-acetylglucosamine--N-acetylmuramyl-(pentapeptide) pyrophosphoryl-undecaprenol N-acetylglucosamine transferase n=1 Tax=Pontixanthobacter gangjinensis TaxID=1028742 RepID=A0A6I4SNM1_9SPHN|nr:undecaprenyldiphospho-muramoylpentapeptide beta-N-acetylglucosaminyltransferase [Pontixanthobacter gangjinensis]MXO56437.1 undecaprenyldiphospho-muramoylpentapeptide beta-N-acetylglucosaminyltransferase [Pontixanthobacter gangjinensis]